MTALLRQKEFQYISMDATMKCCMSILGQESWRASSAKRNAAAFDDEHALRKVLTVRGRTGAVLGMMAISSEKAPEICLALSEMLPAQGRFLEVVCGTEAHRAESAVPDARPYSLIDRV